MSARNDAAALLDVLNAARRIVEFRGAIDEDAFLNDARTQSAIIHQIIVMGEACKRVSEAYRDAHPRIPWRKIAGMRDIVIHEYDDVDLGEVWRVASRDIPALLPLLEQLVLER